MGEAKFACSDGGSGGIGGKCIGTAEIYMLKWGAGVYLGLFGIDCLMDRYWDGIGAGQIYLLGLWGYGEISVDNGVEDAEHKYIF